MNFPLSLSTLILSSAIAAEFMVLRAITAEALALDKKLQPKPVTPESGEEVLGTQVKPFRARMLDTPDEVIEIDARTTTSFLLFVEPSTIVPSAWQAVAAVLHSFQRRYESAAFVVCCGHSHECRRFREAFGLSRPDQPQVKILLDEDRKLMRAFLIQTFPTGIVIDETGRVAKVGRIDPNARGHEHEGT